MAVRLIAIDIDGTLLDSRWQLPDANSKAVVEATSRGVEVALVTGRRYDFARPIAEQLGCPLTLIVNNGAVIKSNQGATQLRHLLPREVARGVLQATPEFRTGTTVVFDRPRENQVIYERVNWEDAGRRSYFERNREFIAQMSPLESCLTEDPIQVMYSGPLECMRKVETVLRALLIRNQFALAATEYESRDFALVDVIHPTCSKGAALAEWAALRGYSRDEVMAIGDNRNDREMLEYAGLPVVMGNSVPELKRLGWRETLSNDQGGVAAAIEAYVLGES